MAEFRAVIVVVIVLTAVGLAESLRSGQYELTLVIALLGFAYILLWKPRA
jgi:uncharacterized membrane protein